MIHETEVDCSGMSEAQVRAVLDFFGHDQGQSTQDEVDARVATIVSGV